MTSSWTIMSISILILLTAGGLHLIQADEMFVCDYQTHGIYMAFVNGTSSFKDANFTLLPLDNVETPIAIQYDLRSRTIYWTDVAKDAIYRSNINGSGYEKIISDLISPQGLAIDIENDRLYWTDSGLDLVESANLDGSNRTVIADTGHDEPRGIAVSVMHRLVFWSDWGEAPKIERANIDGTNRSVIVSANLAWPNGVTIDSSEDRLYWCEAYHDFVESVLLDGSGRIKQIRTSASVNINPFSIAVRGSDDDIYITDTKYKKIIVLDRSKGTFEFIGSFQSPTGLVINQARIAGVCGADGTEPCLNGVCKDNNGTMECQCFPGYTGATCSQELDECASYPCTNGTCVDLINAFVCICTESSRQIIVNCNPEVRQCEMSPCQNNGTCIDEVYDYECVCIDGYMGKNCEIYIDDCSSNPCINGGTCIDLVAAYSCLCPERYAGTNCEASAACSPLTFLNASFPDGREGDVVDSSETCPIYTTLGGTSIGRAECVQNTTSGELAWNITMYLNDCGPLRETNEVVAEIIEKGVTNETVIEVLEVVIVVTDMELDERDIVNIANIISNSTALQSGDPEITTLTATIISNFAERDEDELSAVEENTGAITQILESFQEQLNNLDISDGQSYTALEMNVAVQVTSVEPVNFLSGLTVSASSTSSDLRQTDITLNDGDSIVQEEILTGTHVSIPSSVLNDLSSEDGSESGVRVALTVFSTPSLFASKHIRGTNAGQSSFNRTVNSLVIGLTLGRQKLVTLGENIVFKYTPLQSGFRDPECVFWDFEDTLDWSSRGCRKIPSSGSFQDSEITCSCDHLTNFAVLMDIYYERVEALRIISIIGCAISIVCLVIILITYLSNKNLHVHQSQKIFMCLCGTLLGLYLTFLIMSALDRHPDYPEVTPVPCGILAALVHFFTLSSMAWMGVEGINTYLIVVRVFDAYIPRFMLKASIVAWGVSGLIVLLTGLASQGNYAETDYCFLQKWPSVGGLLIPIAIILLANIVIFSLVVRRLIKSANVASNSDAAGTNRKASIERIKNAVSVLLLLGLTWVTGYLTLIDTTSQVTQTLFIVFNSLQGFFIFILYCARNPVVRAYWAKVCGCGQDSSRTSTRANQGTSQGISLTKTKSTSENDHDYENPSFDENKEYTDLDFSQGKKSGDPTKPTSSGKEYTGLDFSKIEKGGDPTKSFDGKEDVDPAYEVCII